MPSSSNLVNHQHQNARSKDNTQQNHAYRKVWLFLHIIGLFWDWLLFRSIFACRMATSFINHIICYCISDVIY